MEDINFTLNITLVLISILVLGVFYYKVLRSEEYKSKKTYYMMCLNKRRARTQANRKK